MQITVYSTKTGKTTKVDTNATTWGALKNELSVAGLYGDNMNAILQSNKMTLESSDIVMPDIPYTLFIVPTQTKSGVDDCPFDTEEIEDIQSRLYDLLDWVIEHVEDLKKSEVVQLKAEAEQLLRSLPR